MTSGRRRLGGRGGPVGRQVLQRARSLRLQLLVVRVDLGGEVRVGVRVRVLTLTLIPTRT